MWSSDTFIFNCSLCSSPLNMKNAYPLKGLKVHTTLKQWVVIIDQLLHSWRCLTVCKACVVWPPAGSASLSSCEIYLSPPCPPSPTVLRPLAATEASCGCVPRWFWDSYVSLSSSPPPLHSCPFPQCPWMDIIETVGALSWSKTKRTCWSELGSSSIPGMFSLTCVGHLLAELSDVGGHHLTWGETRTMEAGWIPLFLNLENV